MLGTLGCFDECRTRPALSSARYDGCRRWRAAALAAADDDDDVEWPRVLPVRHRRNKTSVDEWHYGHIKFYADAMLV